MQEENVFQKYLVILISSFVGFGGSVSILSNLVPKNTAGNFLCFGGSLVVTGFAAFLVKRLFDRREKKRRRRADQLEIGGKDLPVILKKCSPGGFLLLNSQEQPEGESDCPGTRGLREKSR